MLLFAVSYSVHTLKIITHYSHASVSLSQGGSHRASVSGEEKDPFRFRHMIPTDALQVRTLSNTGKLTHDTQNQSMHEDVGPKRNPNGINGDLIIVCVVADGESAAVCEIIHVKSESEGRPERVFQQIGNVPGFHFKNLVTLPYMYNFLSVFLCLLGFLICHDWCFSWLPLIVYCSKCCNKTIIKAKVKYLFNEKYKYLLLHCIKETPFYSFTAQ